MKKHLYFLLLGSAIYAQNTFPTGAGTAVGIGTGTTAVSGTGGLRLKMNSGIAGTTGLQFTQVNSSTATVTGNNKALSVDASGNVILTPVVNVAQTSTNIYNTDGTLTSLRTVSMNNNNLIFNPGTTNKQFFINGSNGNVGIKTVAPLATLDISHDITNGQTYTDGLDAFNKNLVINAGFQINPMSQRTFKYSDLPSSNQSTQAHVHLAIEDRSDYNRLRFIAYEGGSTKFELSNKLQQSIYTLHEYNDEVKLTLPKVNSFLGIGTESFTDGVDTYRLSVKGAIRAHEVKVYTTWADYVFKDNYKLPSIKDVENYIKTHGHLINVPSAEQVEKEGIKVGEMAKIQQEKIEELTLYIIQQNKEIEELKNQVKSLIEKVK